MNDQASVDFVRRAKVLLAALAMVILATPFAFSVELSDALAMIHEETGRANVVEEIDID